MTKSILLLAAAMLAVGCSTVKPNARTNYVPPSTNKLGAHISNAQEHATKTSGAIKEAAAKAQTVKERLQVLKTAVKEQPPVLSLAVQIEGDVDALTSILLSAGNEIIELQVQLAQAQTEKGLVQEKVNEQTGLLNTANMERNAAITQSKIDRDNAHKFKAILIILGTLAIGVVMFGVFGVKAFFSPLVWVTIGAPLAVGGFLFFWLGSG